MCEPYEPRTYPPVWRIGLAFLTVPGVAALLLAFLMPAYDGLASAAVRVWATAKLYAVVGAYPSAFVFGIPAYFLLRRHFSPRPLPCVIAGAVVASLPWFFVVGVSSSAFSASIGGRATVIDGQYTAYGWLLNAQFVGLIALTGALAGLLFWAVAASGLSPPASRSNIA